MNLEKFNSDVAEFFEICDVNPHCKECENFSPGEELCLVKFLRKKIMEEEVIVNKIPKVQYQINRKEDTGCVFVESLDDANLCTVCNKAFSECNPETRQIKYFDNDLFSVTKCSDCSVLSPEIKT